MYIEIETEDLLGNQITARATGKVFHTVEQPALMFTDNSRYPQHFHIRHAFTENKGDADKVKPLSRGRYQLTDQAFSIDRFKTVTINITGNTLKAMVAAAIPQKQTAV